MEKCVLIRLMIDWPYSYIGQDDIFMLDVTWEAINDAYNHMLRVSFLTYVRSCLQQNDVAIKHTLHTGIINQIKQVFHVDLVNKSARTMRELILWLLMISPFVLTKFIADVVYRPIWSSLYDGHRTFPRVPLSETSHRMTQNRLKYLKHNPDTARLYQLHITLVRKCWNYSQTKIEVVEQQIEAHLKILSRQLSQV